MQTVNILGTEYTIKYITDEEMAKAMGDLKYSGYCDAFTKEIAISTLDNCISSEESKKIDMQQALRHELIHAFLNESGLGYNALGYSSAWAKNEEMVDWIAIQFPKILKAFQEADCL